jgi:hypothetical protein
MPQPRLVRIAGGSLLVLVFAVLGLHGVWSTAAVAPDGVITEASIRGHMEFLAGDALNGRGSGTRDEWLAAAYIASNLTRWNIEPLGDDGGHVQVVRVNTNEAATPPTLSAADTTFTHGKEMLVTSVGSYHVSGPLAKIAEGIAAPAGSIALVPEGMAASAATSEAALVLTVETEAIRARWDQLASRPAPIAPQLVTLKGEVQSRQGRIVLGRDAYALLNALPDTTAIKFDVDARLLRSTSTYNVIGRISGSNPAKASEAILLTAHLDHLGVRGNLEDKIYNGADDDASGVTAVLELAEALSKGPPPERTVIFAWFGSEEAGGYGAAAFVAQSPVPLDRLVANLEFEMIGRPDPAVAEHTLWLTGYERTDLGPELARQGARIVADPHPEQNFFMRSDNIQLARGGVVAQTVSSFSLHSDYHRPSDEIKNIDFPHMRDSIQSMLAPVLWLANSSFKPQWLPGMRP